MYRNGIISDVSQDDRFCKCIEDGSLMLNSEDFHEDNLYTGMAHISGNMSTITRTISTV